MKHSFAVSILALTVSLTAMATMLVRSGASGGASRGGESPLVVPVAASADLAARVEELAASNAVLRDRLAMLETAPVAAQRTVDEAAFASKTEFDAFRDEVRAALGGGDELADRAVLEPDEFKQQVASALSEVRQAEAVEKVRSGLEKRMASLDATMPKIESWLDLTPDQSESMRSAIQSQYERESEYIRQWEAGADPEIIGELKRADREALRTELTGFLNEQQVQTFLSRGGGK